MMRTLYGFRETKFFTKRIIDLISDDEFAFFQFILIKFPESGDLIPGSGGIRKIRIRAKGKGKSGSARVIYYFAAAHSKIYLLDVYAKNEKDDLTLPQLNELRKIVRDWLGE